MSAIIAQNLRAYREAAGYSRGEFAQKCLISRQSLYKHETGQGIPTLENLAKYAAVLGVEVEDLRSRIHPRAWKFTVLNRIEWTKSNVH